MTLTSFAISIASVFSFAVTLGLPGCAQFVLRVGYVTAYPNPVSLRMPVSWFLKT